MCHIFTKEEDETSEGPQPSWHDTSTAKKQLEKVDKPPKSEETTNGEHFTMFVAIEPNSTYTIACRKFMIVFVRDLQRRNTSTRGQSQGNYGKMGYQWVAFHTRDST